MGNPHIVAKIIDALGANPLQEANVQHALTLARKLIERSFDPEQYALLKFYCDWSLHSKIDRSEAGASILKRLHEVVADHLGRDNNSSFGRDVSAVLSLDRPRHQLNALVASFDGPPEVASEAVWQQVVRILVEIVSDIPLSIGRGGRKLTAIGEAVRAQPFKGSRYIEELSIGKFPTEQATNAKAPVGHMTYCVVLKMNDTTRIVTAIVPPWAV